MGDSLYRAAGFGAMMVAIGVLVVGGGCASRSKPSPGWGDAPPAQSPDTPSDAGGHETVTPSRLRVLDERPASAPLAAGIVDSDTSRILQYVSIDPASPARAAVEQTATRPRFNSIRRETARPGQPEQTLSEEHLSKLPDGGIAVEDELVFDEDVQVVYEPPMLLLPAELKPGVPVVQKLKMTVHPLKDRQRVKSNGPVESTITLVGESALQTPAGRLDAMHLRHVFVARLSAAVVTNTTDRWFVPGIGLVCERRAEKTTVAGLQIRSSRADWVLETLPSR